MLTRRVTESSASSSSRKRPYRQGTITRYVRPRKPKIPLAISTRGTPAGYYEIPTVNQFKFYGNTATGLYSTNQDTGVASGATGYRGFLIESDLSNVRVKLGEGTVSINTSQNVTGFNELAAVFDLCKIVRLEVEIRILNSVNDMTTATDQAGLCLTSAIDYNSNVPPSTKDQLLQYSKIQEHFPSGVGNNPPARWNFQPYCITEALSESGSTTASINIPSTYNNCAVGGVVHRGILGWLDLMTAGGTSRTYYMYVTVRQIRRYKMSR